MMFCSILFYSIFLYSTEVKFLKVWEPVWNALTVHAVIGGCITATQWAYWIICLIKKALSACCMVSGNLRDKSSEMLVELMGDSNHRADLQAASAEVKKAEFALLKERIRWRGGAWSPTILMTAVMNRFYHQCIHDDRIKGGCK